MSFTVLLCTDGSDLATAALEHGLDALRPADRIVIATVIELVDPMLVTGTGMAGGVISASELETLQREREDAAADLLTTTRERLGVPEAEGLVLAGAPGPQCRGVPRAGQYARTRSGLVDAAGGAKCTAPHR